MDRPLTGGERELVRSIFGGAIALDSVRLHRRKWMFFQPRRIVMAPDGDIWFHPDGPNWSEDFAKAPIKLQGLFIHEMTHVWQHQKGINLILKRHPFCRYDYSIKPGLPLGKYGIEQQAEIVRHAFLLNRGAELPGAPPVGQLTSILPFRPGG